MNTDRSHAIAWRTFSGVGVDLTEAVLEERLRQFKKELAADLPSLHSLCASILSFSFTPEENRFRVSAHLMESAQIAIRLSAPRDGTNDLFLQDVRRVQAEQARLRESYAWAFFTHANPATDERISKLRRRASRDSRSGQLHIHSGMGGELFDIDMLPRFLPKCTTHAVTVKVDALSRTWIDVQLTEALHGDCGSLPFFSEKKKVRVWRDKYTGDNETTGFLAAAMDAIETIKLHVAVELSWIDGRPKRVTLTEKPGEWAPPDSPDGLLSPLNLLQTDPG